MIVVGTGRGMFVQEDRRAVQTMDAADQVVTTVTVIMDAADQVTTVTTGLILLHDPTGVAAISTRI